MEIWEILEPRSIHNHWSALEGLEGHNGDMTSTNATLDHLFVVQDPPGHNPKYMSRIAPNTYQYSFCTVSPLCEGSDQSGIRVHRFLHVSGVVVQIRRDSSSSLFSASLSALGSGTLVSFFLFFFHLAASHLISFSSLFFPTLLTPSVDIEVV